MNNNNIRQIFLFNFMVLFVVALFIGGCKPNQEKNWQYKRDRKVALVSEKEIYSPLSRDQQLLELKSSQFDVLIIGGGATGAGAALDAATRGLKTALIEAFDFSFGTSSRSTKLVHGGVRYLENAIKHLDWQEYELVRDALQERKRFLLNAPHLTNPLPILTPVYGWFEALYYLAGLKLYDFVSGDASLGRSEFISKETTIARFPMLKKAGLKGSVVFYDGQFDDARMNVTLILTAIREGAIALNYARAVSLSKENNLTTGLFVHDEVGNETFLVRSKVVINATGTFADTIRKMDDSAVADIMVPSQGSHVLLPGIFSSVDSGLIFPKTKDGRVLFLLPWMGKTLVGTTDQPEPITELPKASHEEVRFILDHLRSHFDIPVKNEDVIATWSGLRPLAKPPSPSAETAFISRDHLIEVSKSNLITIVGGKWTTYRKMGEDVINTAISVGSLMPENNSLTKDLKLVGARFFKESLAEELVAYERLEPDIAIHLANSYGDRVDFVIDVDNKSKRARLVDGYPYIEAEVIYAITDEYAVHATDVLARRMRLAFLDNKASRLALPKIITLMAQQLNWDQERQQQEFELANQFLDTMLTKLSTNTK